ncbi:hypothetical protein N865_21475 [Intrasporangium oryzae NRRL B-24470]|uniref:FMN-binding domain-containing protein n=1 Tax=Intrasporangium oryzae NRRL B-24470 TaxID=1386089 RepID=W9G0S9_9MICO|nr:FMN-binding protein [Intrasporangium oryzae]EWS99685.1 hypothetical protein N865_21475 [Intrasporangium oryzae NRRL B-24470]
MRKRTTAVVTLASAASIAASWAVGLHPRRPDVAAGAVVLTNAQAGVVQTDPTPTSGSSPTTKATTSASKKKSSATAKPAPTQPAQPVSGHVLGAPVDTQYGVVQVRVSFTGKHITDVRAVHLTDSSSTSVSISAQAAPVLRQEALAAQSAQIDMVSGATYTSQGYQQSLQSAIDAAHLG